MKSKMIILLFGFICFAAEAQKLTATTPARLQVFGITTDGNNVMMNSEKMSVSYDNLQMTGELALNTLVTNDEILRKLIDSAGYDRITFSGMIPEGKFVFQNTLNSKFTVEADIVYGDRQSRILINYDVSNRKTSSSNTFDINCTGSISLLDDFGISHDTGLQDKISFQFFQNLQTKQY